MHQRSYLFQTFLLIITITHGLHSYAQAPAANELATYMQQQRNLFNKAYEQKDTAYYQRLLDSFETVYKQLPAKEQKTYAPYQINAYYNLSCTYALFHQKTPALDYLERSIKAGCTNYSHIQEDSDLDLIRKEKRYIALIQPLRKIGDYGYILQRGEQYNLHDTTVVPVFTYQSANQPELVALRKAFNLDSIAGEGNETSKVLNLLHWIHNLVPHDGNHENPVVKNALSMIAVCKKDNRGLNCRGLATVLNECYLAMGFKSRFVTCLPKDSLGIDPDCHVINMVYLTSLKKWVWVDPTNDAYVMNEKGELLSIEEVRERLIHKKPLLLNPDANWNHKASTIKANYLYQYMSKNLYMLQCPVSSEYDTETALSGKTLTYVQLTPLDYFKQQPRRKVSHSGKANMDYVYYSTNNSAAFWQAP